MSGELAVVATPIGNLDDLTPRAAACLRAADRVLAEDTRRAKALLRHLGVTGKPVERLDATIEERGVARFVERLVQGERMALVSDAGTPGVSDPGAKLVREAARQGIRVTPLPGPSAVLAALVASGFSAERFCFVGFLPRSGRARSEALENLAAAPEVTVLFEAPPRMAATLAELARAMPAREAMIARELTKLHEELLYGTLAELAERHAERSWRGELTLVLGPGAPRAAERMSERELDRRIDALLATGRRAKDAARALSLESGWPARAIYERISRRKQEP